MRTFYEVVMEKMHSYAVRVLVGHFVIVSFEKKYDQAVDLMTESRDLRA